MSPDTTLCECMEECIWLLCAISPIIFLFHAYTEATNVCTLTYNAVFLDMDNVIAGDVWGIELKPTIIYSTCYCNKMAEWEASS